jgi:VanZ family protein
MKKKKQKKSVVAIADPTNNWDLDYADMDEHWKFDKRSKIICASILILYIIFILYRSFLPGDSVNQTISAWSTPLHYLAYFLLFNLTLISFFVFDLKQPIMKSLLLGGFLAIFTEIIQLFIPGRFGTPADVCTNLAGLFTFPIILLIIYEFTDEEERNNDYGY